MPIQKRFKKPPVISTSALTPIVGPRLLTPKSAAAYLSMSIDVVRDMIQHRRIPYVQNGRRYLIDRLDLDRYIEKAKVGDAARSEEHTSELQSQSNLVCRLLLETKN